jgi:hypothetical protein
VLENESPRSMTVRSAMVSLSLLALLNVVASVDIVATVDAVKLRCKVLPYVLEDVDTVLVDRSGCSLLETAGGER